MDPGPQRWYARTTLPVAEWVVRHRWIARLAVAQAVGVAMLAGSLGLGRPVAAQVLLVIGVPALLSLPAALPPRVRTMLATGSLALGASVLVPLTGQGETFAWLLLALTVSALYQDWVIVPTVLVVAGAHFTLIELGPSGLDPFDLVPLLATVLAGAVHHRSWRLAEVEARTDPLTGLANRRRLREAADRLLRRGGPASLLFLDLDGFKAVNDSRGHAFGDALLVEVAARLRACVRDGDLVVRLGGDEFAVLVPGDPVHAEDVARRVRIDMAVPVQLTGRAVRVTASIGVARTSGTAGRRSGADLLRDADVAMYQAKAAGRNRVVVCDEGMAEAVLDRAALAEDLLAALAAGDQLAVHHQPVVTLPAGVTAGYEALVRWQHPVRGPVPPLDFVPLAEETGAVLALGRWVLRQATRDAAAGLGGEVGPSKVAVNVSSRQLADDGFVDDVCEALRDSGLPADRLVLEVTETSLVEDLDSVCERLQELRALGVRIAIDDFGTGWSSLSYLRRLPVDIVKVDRSFITDLGRTPAATALVATIVELARGLSLDVVAEGVERTDQRDELARLGCAFAQGWLFGRPVPREPVRRAPASLTSG